MVLDSVFRIYLSFMAARERGFSGRGTSAEPKSPKFPLDRPVTLSARTFLLPGYVASLIVMSPYVEIRGPSREPFAQRAK